MQRGTLELMGSQLNPDAIHRAKIAQFNFLSECQYSMSFCVIVYDVWVYVCLFVLCMEFNSVIEC